MKVVILAGGFGTRLSEHTGVIPKPMVDVGGQPILWHIMKYYSHFGFDDFVVALGYKGQVIKRFFLEYHQLHSNLEIDLKAGTQMVVGPSEPLPWKVTLVDTGAESMTGGRLKRLDPYLDGERFMVTYGDGLSDVDLGQLVDFHEKAGNELTITAVNPKSHYGELDLTKDGRVNSFKEKPEFSESWINGGFMVMEPGFLDLIDGDDTILERTPFESAVERGKMGAFKHRGFWQCMDTVRDRALLNDLWESDKASWKVWP